MATLFKQATGLHVVGTDAAILLSRPSCQIEMLGSAIPGQPLLATQLPKGKVHFFPALGPVSYTHLNYSRMDTRRVDMTFGIGYGLSLIHI